ncbi:MAG: NAD(P)H-dependent glycerol-3-phosphate dehydrogenase [Mariprofundaceae bacterium]|nr:NAD(P)H-dependent glycerol-3-phosphate dehydrogenase [Mariprofundaceae bacterium]
MSMKTDPAKQMVCVIGAGSWGTALAMVLARHGRPVQLLGRDADTANTMQQTRCNAAYLADIRFPDSLTVHPFSETALRNSAAVVVATPSSAAESILPLTAACSGPVIAAFKGLNPDTFERTDSLLLRHVGRERAALLSGPSFAVEVARGLPTAITMAASDISLAAQAAAFFDDTSFRIYSSDDMIGVALGGALKNVIAIAAGIAAGLQIGHNAEAALVTRGLAELMRLAEACGARRETLMGLSGLGDLVLTCTGDLSRNRRLGVALAEGLSVGMAKARIGQVAEGIRTARAVHLLAAEKNVDAPLMDTVYQVVTGRLDAAAAVDSLMARPERSEL